ncbi:hypothetical protein SAMN05421504_106370 [Amycolatopsis xylanica]|uniref:SH3 domain-containing protein n=2 Tax=Amycolatopsis xylanica TaxID=589385 RepID=A0A1H3LWT1_9PSEU|nr:hypothetical protein SAMN05421504_106370 [Amycolatopsis xylanica]
MFLGIPKKMLIVIAVLAGVLIVYVLGSDKQSAASSPTGCKVIVTADVLNARDAPAVNGGIVGKYNKDAKIDALPIVQNGYRKIAEGKWVSADFVKPLEGSANCG